MGEEKGLLIRLLLFIILMPVYLLINLILLVVAIINAVISKIGGFLGFILIVFGLLELIGALPVNTDNKTGDIIIIGAGVLCYLIPIVIDEIIIGLQNFSAWIMETVIDA
ncbi:MAG: hypothetical protein E7231_18645 [Cellulosilyticum sp.]|nr:hypothetical protein [Cellulosilyticum sp.]